MITRQNKTFLESFIKLNIQDDFKNTNTLAGDKESD